MTLAKTEMTDTGLLLEGPVDPSCLNFPLKIVMECGSEYLLESAESLPERFSEGVSCLCGDRNHFFVRWPN